MKTAFDPKREEPDFEDAVLNRLDEIADRISNIEDRLDELTEEDDE